jgi:hypothetical protein
MIELIKSVHIKGRAIVTWNRMHGSDSEPMGRLHVLLRILLGKELPKPSIEAMERWIHVVKLLRAHGGCLGVRRR